MTNSVPSSVIEKTYETCQERQQLRQGDLRIYVTLIESGPDYVVLWVFAVKKHRYRNLGKFDAEAGRRVAELKHTTTTPQVETYLENNQALSVGDLRDLREKL